MLSLAYISNRLDNRIEWFFDSLHNETRGDYTDMRVIIVDFFAQVHGPQTAEAVEQRKAHYRSICQCPDLIHIPPMGNVWQGPYRLATRDYWDAANTRNTAICHAPDGHIAFVDDISVLLPGWLSRVRAAVAGNYIAFGTYKKVQKLEVEKGVVKSCVETAHGDDHRAVTIRKRYAKLEDYPRMVQCGGSWLFGCSLVSPVNALLAINGFDLDTGSMSYEDTAAGAMLEMQGFKLFFDLDMQTLESEELHYVETPFLRIDKPNVGGHRDASNAYVVMLKSGRKRAPNYYGFDGLAAVRRKVLAGESPPIIQSPQHDWRDGQLISSM